MKTGPRYGLTGKSSAKAAVLFGNMQQRCRTGYSETSYSWDEKGLKDLIFDIGEIPQNIPEPSLGRLDHSSGYVKGNIFWQCVWENRAEASKSGRARRGKTHSDETKAKMAKVKLGKKFSEETKKLMSESAISGWNNRRIIKL